jgi:hypothetical protein
MSETLGTIITAGNIQARVRETLSEIQEILLEEDGALFITLHDHSDGLPQVFGVMHLTHLTPGRPLRPQVDVAAGVPLVGLGR